MLKIFLVIIALLVLRDLLAWLFGWGDGETFVDLMENSRYNREIDRKWKQDGKPIVGTTIGWRPDPINKADGVRDNHDGSYSRLIRGGTKEYREKFSRDVENSKK